MLSPAPDDRPPVNAAARTSQPVFRLMMLSFLLVALFPVGILGVSIYNTAWNDAWREIREKHQLLAQNLAAPIHIHVTDHREMLRQLAEELGHLRAGDAAMIRARMDQALSHMPGFQRLMYAGPTGRTLYLAPAADNPQEAPLDLSAERCFVRTRTEGRWVLSGVKPSPVTGEPTVIMSQPVHRADGSLAGVLLAELRLSVIESLRRRIRFGRRGHSAIVDNFGRVVAHPNPQWMKEMRDLSAWPVVQAMLAGKTGVTEFYSPFIQADMVAGYAAVPEIGWGIMVPQPKSEVAAHVDELMRSHLVWLSVALVLALLLALRLARWITRPINELAAAAEAVADGEPGAELPPPPPGAPTEVRRLGTALSHLVRGLQHAHREVRLLNESLQQRINEATRQLRDANERLQRLAQMDYLTTLLNRRSFESELNGVLRRRASDQAPMCLLLIDIDHFKRINDRYGHAAGDAVLIEVARVLREAMRPGDLLARYAGDEFVAQMNCDEEVGLQRADDIRRRIGELDFRWEGEKVELTVSVGLLCGRNAAGTSLKEILHQVDTAMYAAKKRGRNTVVRLGH